MKRFRLSLLLGVLLLCWANCTTMKQLPVDTVTEKEGATLASAPGERIFGYTTKDAAFHPYEGYTRVAGVDSMGFYRNRGGGVSSSTLSLDFTLAKADLSSYSVRRVKVVETIGLTVAVVVVVVAVVAAIIPDKNPPPPPQPTYPVTSCPFVYSWNGKEYVLDAEPYGGATIKALERTDACALENLVESNGRYRLLLTNEMEETQHTNRIDLLVVDHPPGSIVAADLDGSPHAFHTVDPLVEARDQSGRDLLAWLREKDQVMWHPDLVAASSTLPLADTRDHITLTFNRPGGVKSAYLLADAATAPWGARMIRTMLEMRGLSVGLFYAAVNLAEGAREKLHEWNEREELFYLAVEVEEGGRWVKQARLIGGGPIVTETRAIPLDLSRVTGDKVRLRIHPPVGFWMFNSFHLAYGEQPVRTQVVAPISAVDASGSNVLSKIARDDGDYLDFPTNSDRAVVEFPAPPPNAALQRSVFCRARGWYEIRLNALAVPDFQMVDKITNEPGYPVQRAMRDYRSFREAQISAEAGASRRGVAGE